MWIGKSDKGDQRADCPTRPRLPRTSLVQCGRYRWSRGRRHRKGSGQVGAPRAIDASDWLDAGT
eukprot:14268525-Alexandrium_andersonii.AAC.1